MKTLGISSFFHDSASSLVCDNKVVSASEEERFSRIKHDNDFPNKSIDFILSSNNLNTSDLDYVVFYEKPLLKLQRILSTQRKNFISNQKIQEEFFQSWNKKKLQTRNYISDLLKINKKKILFYEHHFSHTASSYFCSGFENSDILTLDGVGEWCTSSFGYGKKSNIFRTQSVDFPHSIGLLYSAFTEFLGFEVNEGEFKVMGMAPYGKPKYLDKIDKLFKSNGPDFTLNMKYFNFNIDSDTNLSSKFLEEFGDRRLPNEAFLIEKYKYDLELKDSNYNSKINEKSIYYADIASSLQEYLENMIVKNLELMNKTTNNNKLCYAGGVAYNGSINQKIIKSGIYDDLFIQPAAGDSGGALGCALGVNSIFKEGPINYANTYLGKGFKNDEIRQYLDSKSIEYKFYENSDKLYQYTAEKISSGNVIGWFQGKAEFGPRALGNRSILADPRFFKNKRIINSKIKFREIFRPFAPTTIKEYCSQYYDINEKELSMSPYKYMLAIAEVNSDFKDKLGAVTHVNNTARVQVLDKVDNLKFYKLIKSFGDITGIYTLLNTSFNRKGEPIVNSPEDACNVFFWTDLDILVINNFLIEKKR